MSRQKPSKKLSSTNLNDDALTSLLEPLADTTAESVSGGAGQLSAKGGQRSVGLSFYVHNDISSFYVHNDIP
jgi:hypothetical protein